VCRIQIPLIFIDDTGAKGDREFMVVDEEGTFLTQRKLPRMALIQPSFQGINLLVLNAPNAPQIIVPIVKKSENSMNVRVWKDNCRAIDQGDEVSQWLCSFLNTKCRLVRFSDDDIRPLPVPLLYKYSLTSQEKYDLVRCKVKFCDGGPLMMVSEASLEDLNTRLDEQVPINRFRPNILVSGCEAFEEDRWKVVMIGTQVFTVAADCTRCKIPTVNQESGVMSPVNEPFQTLTTYRTKKKHEPCFGKYIVHETRGEIKVGDEVLIGGIGSLLWVNLPRILHGIPWLVKYFVNHKILKTVN